MLSVNKYVIMRQRDYEATSQPIPYDSVESWQTRRIQALLDCTRSSC